MVTEPLGVLLATEALGSLAGRDGVRLDALAGLDWVGFPRAGSPAWYDRLTGTMRGHGLDPGSPPPDDNAGVFPFGPTAQTAESDFDRVYRVNVQGALLPRRGPRPGDGGTRHRGPG